jgi:hypothetical protein
MNSKEVYMSRQLKILVFSFVCLAALVILIPVDPAQGGGKSSPPISLRANFEPLWFGASTNIRNDIEGSPFFDMTDTKRAKYGVSVKFYPAGGSDPRGRFKMIIDQSGALGRYIKLFFMTPLGGAGCIDNNLEGCNIDPLGGGIGVIDTKLITIDTQVVYVESADGKSLVMDTSQPIGMDLMKTGESKIVGLGISFTPENSDYDYHLGFIPDPNNPAYDPNLACQNTGWPFGTAELFCVAAGQQWEFRPHQKNYTNDPGSLNRWLTGQSTILYYRVCNYNRWHMPFVLRVTKQ